MPARQLPGSRDRLPQPLHHLFRPTSATVRTADSGLPAWFGLHHPLSLPDLPSAARLQGDVTGSWLAQVLICARCQPAPPISAPAVSLGQPRRAARRPAGARPDASPAAARAGPRVPSPAHPAPPLSSRPPLQTRGTPHAYACTEMAKLGREKIGGGNPGKEEMEPGAPLKNRGTREIRGMGPAGPAEKMEDRRGHGGEVPIPAGMTRYAKGPGDSRR